LNPTRAHDPTAEIEFLDILVVTQFVGGAVEHDLPSTLDNAAVARDWPVLDVG